MGNNLATLAVWYLTQIAESTKWLKNRYGSNWRPLLPVNKSHLKLLFNIATYVQETISSGTQADFTNLAETLAPYLEVRYTNTRLAQQSESGVNDSWLYWDTELNQAVIIINADLPENERNFEIAYELASLVFTYGWGIEEKISDTRHFYKRVCANKRPAYNSSSIFLNCHSHKRPRNITSVQVNYDDLLLSLACMIIIPKAQLNDLLKQKPNDIIKAICYKFKVSARIANFSMNVWQTQTNTF